MPMPWIEIHPGFAATKLLYGDKGGVVGITTGGMDVGRNVFRSGIHMGIELRQLYLLEEGARGSLSSVRSLVPVSIP
jgi:electron-transferring-flavoprotein dehydrogenase